MPVGFDLNTAQWLLNQGVAIAILAVLLSRFETRMARLERLLQYLVVKAGGDAAVVLDNGNPVITVKTN
jgi:hypothetical protein